MIDLVVYATFILPFIFPVVPWLYGRHPEDIRKSTWIMTALLCAFPFIFWFGCAAANCGQGSIALLPLLFLCAISGVATWQSAQIAARWRSRQGSAQDG